MMDRFLRPIAALSVFLITITMWLGAGHVRASVSPKPVLVLREGLDGAINEWSGPAKFVLYNDGTLITETSNETSEQGGDPSYYITKLTAAQSQKVLKSLDVQEIIKPGAHEYGHGEGTTWQLIYWGAKPRGEMTVVDSLKYAPTDVADLVRKLENYPKAGTRYLAYNYLIDFSNPIPTESEGLPWPNSWQFFKFSKPMLSGYRAPDVLYEYHIDAPDALKVLDTLKRAKSDCVGVNGHLWDVRLSPAPRLPDDLKWVSNPVS